MSSEKWERRSKEWRAKSFDALKELYSTNNGVDKIIPEEIPYANSKNTHEETQSNAV